MRVMLDTNILVSAFVFKSKKMNKLIYEISKNHKIVICSYTIKELKELMKEKFKVNINELYEFLDNFPFELVYSSTTIPDNKLFEIRDKDDYIILHTAVTNNVDVFITGDKDFDDVNVKKPEIMNTTKFLEKYC